MKSKKVIVLLISLTLLVSMTLPGTVVVSADQAADSGHRTLMPVNEEKDTPPEGAGDPDSSGANQSEDPPVPSGAAQSEDPPAPSGANQSEDPPAPSGVDQGGDPPALSGVDQGGNPPDPSGSNQSADPSQPEEPGNTGEQNTCTCGAAQGKAHGVECPLYDPADVIPTEPAKECNCGHEDGTHAENCPLYVAPEGLEEEEEQEQEESNGASLTVSVQVSGEDRNAVLNLTGPGDYRKRIVVHGSSTVTLSGLEAGAYTVTGGTSAQSVTLEAGESNSVDITVARSSYGWLTGEAYQTFTFNS